MMTIFGSWYFQPQLGWAKIRYIEFAGVRATGSPCGHGVYFLMGELDVTDHFFRIAGESGLEVSVGHRDDA